MQSVTFSDFFRIGLTIFILLIVYLTSYSPYLKLTQDSDSIGYRSPKFYRPAEWIIVKTPLQPVILQWAEFVGVRGRTELQSFYYAQGISDPGELHFNFGPSDSTSLP